ncbi:MAG: T9SS type A sorting domain-containing protein [Bacteroidales bacterium]|nr:T9SS type A sorting domain-containing protein [Bacteroidales bacterium]
MNYRKIIILLIFVFSIGCIYASQKIEKEQEQKTIRISDKKGLNIVNKDNSNFNFENYISEIKIKQVLTKKGTFSKIILDGYGKSSEIGNPELPVLRKLVEIPHGTQAKIKIISYSEEIINLNDHGISSKIFPRQASLSKNNDPLKVEFVYNENYYNENKFNDSKLADIQAVGVMRGVQIGRLTISPVQYNPQKNILKIYKNIEVEVYFEDIETKNSIVQKTYSPFFINNYSKLINYFAPDNKDINTRYPVKYVIISDPMFRDALQPFVEWKTKKGFIVIEAYTDDSIVGTTTTSIKAYLKNLYDSATVENPAPTFGLIVGDVGQIPAFNGQTEAHVTDLYYFEYTGDIFPEVYYGRFSANNLSELQAQIDKTLEYEQFLMPDNSFFNEVVMVAGMDDYSASTYGNGQVNYGTGYYFNNEHGINAHSYLYPESGSNAEQIISKISNGVAFANYTAHCSPSGWSNPAFSISDIAGLHNNSKYPTMIGNCCQSSAFDMQECFAEAILRAENKGAIGYIGGSNYTYWDEDYFFTVGVGNITANPTYEETSLGAFDCVFHDNGENENDWYVANGQIVTAGNLAVTEGGTDLVNYYWEIYHLMGDPSLMTYFSVPEDLGVSYSENIPLGLSDLEVTTEHGAFVAISNNNLLLDSKIANNDGIADLQFTPFSEPTTATIVVTKQNKKPFTGQLLVIPTDIPYIIYVDHFIDDKEENNNLLPDYGETIYLDISFENIGGVDSEEASVIMSSDNEYITIIDSTENLGIINSDSVVTVEKGFSFLISDSISDQHIVTFNLNVTDNSEETWTSKLSITLNAPDLEVDLIYVNDSVGGNSNNYFDPGETVEIGIKIKNNGHSDSPESVCWLSSRNSDITIYSEEYISGKILNKSEISEAFIVTINSSCSLGEIIELDLFLDAGYYSVSKTLQQKVGLSIEDWETADFNKYNWDTTGTNPWIISDTTFGSNNDTILPYSGIYTAKSAPISDDNYSSLLITIDVLADDSISFYKKVSCEEGDLIFDHLKFLIDNKIQKKWDGEDDWSFEMFPVIKGNHTFEWRYVKDEYVVEGEDCAWIDYIMLPAHEWTNQSENNIPVFVSFADTIIRQDELYIYNINVSDEDNDYINITCPVKPEWLELSDINNGSATLSGTPLRDDIGEHLIVLSATDGTIFESQAFNIKVKYPAKIEIADNNEFDFNIFPNPLQNNTILTYYLINKSSVSLVIYNSFGQQVKMFNHNVMQSEGYYSYKLQADFFNSGVYYAVLSVDNKNYLKKFIVIE